MKRLPLLFISVAALVIVLLIAAPSQSGQSAPMMNVAMMQQMAAAQYAIEVGSQFSPATIHVKRGVPVRPNFRSSGKPTCASSVTFPA